jgi:hypothetical protein
MRVIRLAAVAIALLTMPAMAQTRTPHEWRTLTLSEERENPSIIFIDAASVKTVGAIRTVNLLRIPEKPLARAGVRITSEQMVLRFECAQHQMSWVSSRLLPSGASSTAAHVPAQPLMTIAAGSVNERIAEAVCGDDWHNMAPLRHATPAAEAIDKIAQLHSLRATLTATHWIEGRTLGPAPDRQAQFFDRDSVRADADGAAFEMNGLLLLEAGGFTLFRLRFDCTAMTSEMTVTDGRAADGSVISVVPFVVPPSKIAPDTPIAEILHAGCTRDWSVAPPFDGPRSALVARAFGR